MRYLQADLLFDGREFLPAGAVLVVDDQQRIAGILPERLEGDVEFLSGLLMPGMVNAHCHLELSHLYQQIPKGTGLVDFVRSVGKLRTAAPEHIQESIRTAEHAIWERGILAVGDIVNTADTLAAKQAGKLNYHTLVECFGLLENLAPQRMQHARDLWQQFSRLHPTSLTLHAPYSFSMTLLHLLKQENKSTVFSIHNQECLAENELFQTGKGDFQRLFQDLFHKPYHFPLNGPGSLQTIWPLLPRAPRTILVHNTCTSTSDISMVMNDGRDTYWCLCPAANLYIEGRLPDVPLLLESGCKMVLGTDSLASNDRLDLFHEIDLLKSNFPQLPIATLLNWATLQGACALGMEQALGSFDTGKQPGLLHVPNVLDTHAWPAKKEVRWL